MLKFAVYDQGQRPGDWPLRNAYLIGTDGNPVRADITYDVQPGPDGDEPVILCEKREAGTAALVLQHDCGDLGELTLQTCLLPESNDPYILHLELARHRLMTLYTRLEEWSMFDLDPDHSVPKRANKAREHFIAALCAQRDDPAQSAEHGQQCLVTALDGSEELALAHSELLLNRRRETSALPERPFGVGLSPGVADARVRGPVASNFDFLQLSMPWRLLCPEENDYDWSVLDPWMEWAAQSKVPVVAGPIVGFDPQNLPDWLYIWEHDYDTVRDVIYEHIERVVERYKGTVDAWNVLSGLHVNNHFTFNFEQLVDLSRMVLMLTRKLHPAGKQFVEIRQPFGEYYASNQRSIPPLIYADLLAQSGVPFDGFVLRLPMGQAVQGQFTRDLMQLSCLLEEYAVFGKPLHLSVAAPSAPVTSVMIADPKDDQPVDANCGHWRRPWSLVVQSHWLEAVFQIAMSKPYVESVAWHDFVDHPQIELPMSGLVNESLQVKESMRRLIGFRKSLLGLEDEKDTSSSSSSTASRKANSDSNSGQPVGAGA